MEITAREFGRRPSWVLAAVAAERDAARAELAGLDAEHERRRRRREGRADGAG
ncbi:hypothetical protein [Streptomyces cinereoruber]